LRSTSQHWEDLEAANANGRVIPFTLEATRERIAGRSGKPDLCDFTVYDRADQAPIGWGACHLRTIPSTTPPVRHGQPPTLTVL
jgi:hypothetical protein